MCTLHQIVYYPVANFIDNLTHQTPRLYSFTGIYRGIHCFFIFLLKNTDCGYSLEPPRRGGSNEYPQSMCGAEI